MEPEQRKILIKNRPKLVSDINVQDGLYTELLARGVFNSRTVNRIKSHGTPEGQVETLLDELAKKDCFSQFCEALVADDQEHIVNKYLKLDTSQSAAASSPSKEATTSKTNGSSTSTCESTDSLAAQEKAPVNVICIKETEGKPQFISFIEESSPRKRARSEVENAVLPYEEGETRYVPKHFVAEKPDELSTDSIIPVSAVRQTQFVVLNNPQNPFLNPNISDPKRYSAAFPIQTCSTLQSAAGDVLPHVIPPAMSSPLKDPSSRINEQGQHKGDPAYIRNLLRPTVSNTHSGFHNFNITAQNGQGFVRLSPSLTSNGNFSQQSSGPQQYLHQTGMLSTAKGAIHTITASHSPPTKDPGFIDQAMQQLRRSDAVDSLKCSVLQNVFSGTTLQTDSSIPLSKAQLLTGSQLSEHTVFQQQQACPDMDSVDLPDGCVNVKVEHCSKEFFLAHYKKSYEMGRIPRGLALIINVDEVEGKPARKGTNFDRDNLCNLLSQLHFNILSYNDQDGLSAQEIVIKLRAFAKLKDHYNYNACFICLLSHGEEEYIFGTDGKRIPLNEIFMLFDNQNCKGLMGKPKIFIIQACRGGLAKCGLATVQFHAFLQYIHN